MAGVAITRKRLKGGKYFYRPIILGEEDGDSTKHKPPTVVGEGVVTLEEHRRIIEMIDKRTSQRGRKRSDSRFAKSGRRTSRTLLAEFGRCGRVNGGEECGSRIVGTGRTKDGQTANYVCLSSTSRARGGSGTCQGMYTAIRLADEVGEQFINRLAACEPGDPLLEIVAERWTARNRPEEVAERKPAEQTVRDVQSALTRVEDAYADGLYDRDGYRRQRERLTERLKATQEELRKAPKPEADISPLLDPELSRPAWDSAGVAERRALLSLAVDTVTILPAERRGALWHRDRVQIRWLDETD